MMRTKEKDLALLYFENQSVLPEVEGFVPGSSYSFQWYNTLTGEWFDPVIIKADEGGKLIIPVFPDEKNPSVIDWAGKIKIKR
jgi:hypothetical protein